MLLIPRVLTMHHSKREGPHLVMTLCGKGLLSHGDLLTRLLTALSTCEAEIYALSEGAKDLVYFRNLLAGLGTSPTEDGTFSLCH